MSASSTRPKPPRTLSRALDVAERLVQTRGYNGFSYANVAAELGITSASLHYHFPAKADLGRALVERYTQAFEAALEAIDAKAAAGQRLRAYVRLYADVLAKERMCMCGMLAAEYSTLPAAMQSAVRAFFDANERWLSGELKAGRDAGTLDFQGTARQAARIWTSTLEGAMLLARSYGDPTRLSTAANHLLEQFSVGAARSKGSRRRRR